MHDIAAQLLVTPAAVIAALRDIGEQVRGPSSIVSESALRKLTASGRLERTPRTRNSEAESLALSKRTPQSIESGWRAGAVKAPTHDDLLRNTDALLRSFPRLRSYKTALNELGSQIVYAGRSGDKNFEECGVALVRFSGAIEEAFGFTREVMIFLTPHRDLQIRTYQAAVRELRTLRREVTPDLIFISSPDPRVRTKLEDWSTAAVQAIPLESDEDLTALQLISHIRDYVFTRNLFYETGPVSGDRFFGRREILQSLRDDILHGRVAGLFGLRKAGKTSVLMQLASDLEGRSIVSVFMDLEAFPSPPEDPTDEILATLRVRLLEQLKAHGLRTKELAELSEVPSIVQFKMAFQALLKRIEGSGDRILLLLDEIEYLTPADAIDIAEGDMPRVAQLLAALRSIAQENQNFTFLLSGLTSAIIESGRLYGRPNPLFSWAKAYYLGPLSMTEASELAVSVGARMGIELEPKALSALYEASGGHAFLYRNFASTIVQKLPIDVFRRRLTKSIVLSELRDWRAKVHGNITEMIAHVARYYPTESVLLEVLRDEPQEFASFDESDPQAVRHLLDLGLVQIEEGVFELNPVLALQ